MGNGHLPRSQERFMMSLRWFAAFGLALFLAAPAAHAQRGGLHVGYVYPAGGKQGSTFEAVIGGQFLGDVDHIYVSGGGVQAKIVELVRPITGREINELRIMMDELLARRAVVHDDFKALQNYRSFKGGKNAKNTKADKPDSAAADKEIEELKKKYAHATWTAADDRQIAEIRKKMSGAVRKPANPAISEILVLEMTVAADAAAGRRELRVGTPSTISNPLVFHVGQLPEFSAKASKSITEQKSAIAKTAVLKSHKKEAEMEITLPAVVNGQILPGAVDRYRLTARKGQRLVISAAARELIPYIADAVPGWFQATLALYDAQGKELAYVDDFRFNPDPVLYYVIPADGTYAIEIKDAIFRGREDFVYRITVGELPFLTGIFPLGGRAGQQTTVEAQGWNLAADRLTIDGRGGVPAIRGVEMRQDGFVSNSLPFAVDTLPECLEREPNDAPDKAQPVTLPVIVNGRIDRPDDTDVFRFQGQAGQEIVAEVLARRLDSPLDSVLTLTDAGGRQLAYNDDFDDKGAGLITHQADSYLRATLPADGTYYLRIADMQHQGGPEYAYRLRISPPRPDFDLRIVPSGLVSRLTSTVIATVYALRRDGFDGEIALALKDAPPGFTLSGGRVPAGENLVRLTLNAPAAAQSQPCNVRLEGRATIDGREVAHPVVPADDMMQAFEYRHLVPAQELKVAVTGRRGARARFKILNDMPIKIAAGGTARVKVDAPASKFLDNVRFELSDPPPGIAIQGTSPAPAGVEIILRCDAAAAKPGLKGNLLITVAPEKSRQPTKGKSKSPKEQARLILPAVPFEVVAP
jgi:hypothetical protein